MVELYPPIEPYDQGMLDVGDGNLVYWETCGNPDGKPALVVHGGPGSGCTAGHRRYFDPARYRAVLFDQRGCGRSTPHASDPATDMSHNTTEHLLADMERLREHLGIERWLLRGGSWGSTLILAYAERYPHRVSEIVITGVTTSRRSEIDWLYRGVGCSAGFWWMMNAVESSERLIELVRGSDDIANHADGCDTGMITIAERDLGVTFPPSYRRLIEEFGTWDIAGEEFLGVYQTPAIGQKLLGSVTETLNARSQYGMPFDLIAVMFDGMGGLVVLDTSQPDQDGEYPVLVWNPGSVDRESMERVGDDFGSFALSLCQRAVTRWRESS